MKILLIFILTSLVSCLALKSEKRPGPPTEDKPSNGEKPRGPRPAGPSTPGRFAPNQNDADKNGWGWNGRPLSYGKPPRCLDPSKVPSTDDWDQDFFDRERLWYSTGGTKYGYNTYYRVLNGHYAHSQAQLDQMCPAAIFSTTGPIIVSGSGVQFTQICTPGQISTCYMSRDITKYDEGVDVFSVLEHQVDYIIKTDNKTYVIYYQCNDFVNGDLQLLTTRPYVSPETYSIFLSYFKTFNISISQAQAGVCRYPNFPGHYPHPFENYPHSAGGNGWGQQDGWGSPSPPTNGWSFQPDNSEGSQSNGWGHDSSSSNLGWGESNGWGPEPSNGWGWDAPSNGWGSHWGKKVEPKKEEKKTEIVPAVEVNQ